MKIHTIAAIIVSAVTTNAAISAELNHHAFTLEVKDAKNTSAYGTGTLVKHGTNLYYVTAHHIFGGITEQELKASLKLVTFISESDKRIQAKPEAYIPLQGTVDLSKNDFLVFKVRNNPTLSKYALPLANESLQKDEIVFLAARLPNKPLGTYSLKVLEANDDRVRYEKIPQVEKYTGASGGPIINSKGELVGTYLGRSVAEDQSIISLFGTPYVSLKNALLEAAKAQK